MLVFFIHGVATTDTKYAAPLEALLKEELAEIDQPLPHFYASFYGDVVKDVGKIWNWIDQDLGEFKKEYSQADIQDIIRYQKFRRGLMSEFIGDTFTYLNSERGAKIRELIADQLDDFINNHSDETGIHIVAHSLGSVVLWDCLFSDRFDSKDAAFKIRTLLQGSKSSDKGGQVYLRSMTTMGSPILYFNMMLNIKSEQVKAFVNSYQRQPLKWINIIHSSDILAYPLRASLNIEPSGSLNFQDHFIRTDANPAERAVRNFIDRIKNIIDTISQFSPVIKEAIDHAPMVAGIGDGHTGYWNCRQTASLIKANLIDVNRVSSVTPIIEEVIHRLKKVTGITKPLIDLGEGNFDRTLEHLRFKDNSGTLQLVVNPLQVHHVFVNDQYETRQYAGYVGLIHGHGLREAVELIKRDFC